MAQTTSRRLSLGNWVGVLPFLIFTLLFLILPTMNIVLGAFRTPEGAATLANLKGLFTPSIMASYWISIKVSLASALFGCLIGFGIAASVTLGGLPAWLRGPLMTFSGVASNFAGVPLAFAFLATLGRLGLVTVLLKSWFGINIYAMGFNLLSFWGLTLTYLFFQIPLMVLIITPALDGLKREWREAASVLGATGRNTGAWCVADPDAVLAGHLRAVVRQCVWRGGYGLCAHRILAFDRADRAVRADPRRCAGRSASGLCAGLRNDRDHRLCQCDLYLAEDAGREVDAMNRFWSWLAFSFGALYFLLPLLGTLEFSLKMRRGVYSLDAYRAVLSDPQFQQTFGFSVIMALFTIAFGMLLVVPTAYWVRLRLPKLRPFIEFITLMPLVIPPIVIVFGYIRIYNTSSLLPMTGSTMGTNLLLMFGYTTLSLPYMYRAVDTGLRTIDVATLTEAAQSLGAGWVTILARVIMPNVLIAVLSGAFVTFAIVIGEFVLAALLNRPAFGPYLQLIGANKAYEPAALAVISFAITWGVHGAYTARHPLHET